MVPTYPQSINEKITDYNEQINDIKTELICNDDLLNMSGIDSEDLVKLNKIRNKICNY